MRTECHQKQPQIHVQISVEVDSENLKELLAKWMYLDLTKFKRSVSKFGASGSERLDDPRNVVTDETEPRNVTVCFHRSP